MAALQKADSPFTGVLVGGRVGGRPVNGPDGATYLPRSTLYEFSDRLEPFWHDWNEQTLHMAQEQGISLGDRVAVDGTLIAALAWRHRMVNQTTLADRLDALQQAVATNDAGLAVASTPDKHPETRERQRQRYEQAQVRMHQLQAESAHRTSSKRKKPRKSWLA